MLSSILISLTLLFSTSLHPDVEVTAQGCVYGAKDVDSYRVLETGYGAKIYFSGGYNEFIIELSGSLYSSSIDDIFFIKDDFCSYESDVLVIDEEVFGVNKVTKL